MGKTKYDGVIEAAHYNLDGMVSWVRVYRRRGPTFSDRILMNREELIKELKSGRVYYSGKRIPYMAGTFEVSEKILLEERDGKEVLLIGEHTAEKDQLTGLPII
jgi:hypothetical protein